MKVPIEVNATVPDAEADAETQKGVELTVPVDTEPPAVAELEMLISSTPMEGRVPAVPPA